jgi:hypothetical protein
LCTCSKKKGCDCKLNFSIHSDDAELLQFFIGLN